MGLLLPFVTTKKGNLYVLVSVFCPLATVSSSDSTTDFGNRNEVKKLPHLVTYLDNTKCNIHFIRFVFKLIFLVLKDKRLKEFI